MNIRSVAIMNDKIDLRVLKTLDNIRNGFAFCIQKKTFSSITIKDITTAARVNRTTFYKYYTDKYHLRESLVKSTLDDLSNDISLTPIQLPYNKDTITNNSLINRLEYMYNHKDWYLILWNKNMELNIFDNMVQLFEKQIRESNVVHNNEMEIARKDEADKQELFARLFASSAMTTVKWWYEYSPNKTPKEVAVIITNNINLK
jgi:AcrR family transcriptional regulator